MQIPVNELALAYELRQEGCSWKRIAIGLGVEADQLYAEVRHIRRHGLTDSRRTIAKEDVLAALEMRQNSRLSWKAIGAYLGYEWRQIELACWRKQQHDRSCAQCEV